MAFPGVAALYRGLHEGPGGDEGNPMLYVSRAPWSIYEVLEAWEKGAYNYMTKPLDAGTFMEHLVKILRDIPSLSELVKIKVNIFHPGHVVVSRHDLFLHRA